MLGKDITLILVITLVTVIGWITYDIYTASTESTLTPLTKKYLQVETLDPTLREDVLKELIDDAKTTEG